MQQRVMHSDAICQAVSARKFQPSSAHHGVQEKHCDFLLPRRFSSICTFVLSLAMRLVKMHHRARIPAPPLRVSHRYSPDVSRRDGGEPVTEKRELGQFQRDGARENCTVNDRTRLPRAGRSRPQNAGDMDFMAFEPSYEHQLPVGPRPHICGHRPS